MATYDLPPVGSGARAIGVEGIKPLPGRFIHVERQPSRFLAASAAGFLARTLPAFAAAPYAIKHGAFELAVVSDGHLVLPTSFLAPDAPAAQRDALLKAAGQTGEQYNSPTNVTLIRSGTDLILVDMGSGDRFMPTAGKLWDNLKTAGIDKAKITKVVFTHGHPDHLWGAIDELDELIMPDATFYVASAEWNFWTGDNATRGLPRRARRFRHRRTSKLCSDQRQDENGQRRR